VCCNATFQNCEFGRSDRLALVADGHGSHDVKFIGCSFVGTHHYSVHINDPRYSFEKCSFFGATTNLFRASNSNDGLRFKHCTFADTKKAETIEEGRRPKSEFLQIEDPFFGRHSSTSQLVDMWGPPGSDSYAVFENCEFIGRFQQLGMLNGVTIKDCEFSVQVGSNTLEDGTPCLTLYNSVVSGCKFIDDIKGARPNSFQN
jgi:hypothetical protein